MSALVVALVLCLPFTVDAVDGGTARVETRCGDVLIHGAPWLHEGWTTAPWRVDRLRRLRESIPVGPAGDLSL